MSSLGIIPVRAQSTRLPNKAFRICGGKSLLQWTLETASQSNLDQIIVVTSNQTIRNVCDEMHIQSVQRPTDLEWSHVSILDTIMWLNDSPLNSSFSVQMLLQITNPTRTVEDIDTCLDMLTHHHDINSVCSVTSVGEFHPNRMYIPQQGKLLKPLLRSSKQFGNTQELPKIFLRDGGVYAWKTKAWTKQNGATLLPDATMYHEIDPCRSVRIDEERDLEKASIYLLTCGQASLD